MGRGVRKGLCNGRQITVNYGIPGGSGGATLLSTIGELVGRGVLIITQASGGILIHRKIYSYSDKFEIQDSTL